MTGSTFIVPGNTNFWEAKLGELKYMIGYYGDWGIAEYLNWAVRGRIVVSPIAGDVFSTFSLYHHEGFIIISSHGYQALDFMALTPVKATLDIISGGKTSFQEERHHFRREDIISGGKTSFQEGGHQGQCLLQS